MSAWLAPFREVDRPPKWAPLVGATVTVGAFVVLLPYGPDPTPDIVIEGLFLLTAVLLLVPVRRLDIGVLEIGWLIFVFGRLMDFLDELFVEPEPFVEPYLSGFLMVVSLAVTLGGVYTLLEERNERVAELGDRTADLALKNAVNDEAPVGITVADMSQDGEPLVEINDAFEDLTGYSTEETLGKNCRFLQGEETEQERVDRMRDAIDAGESVQVTLRNYRRDGTMFWNEVTLAPLAVEGRKTEYYVGFQQDVTDREEYRRQLERQRNNLNLLNQMIQHDIRNDLQLVRGHAGLLEEHVAPEGRSHLETVQEAAADSISITRTARDLSETILNDTPELEAVPLRGTLRGEVSNLRSAHDDARVVLDGEIPDVSVVGDELLESVFRNVLGNAIEHNDKATPEVTVSATPVEDHVETRSADNGPGIPDGRKTEIFAQGEKGLESEGTGIGTYLVDTLVTRYGGDVWVEDNDPTGAVFVVRLPLAE